MLVTIYTNTGCSACHQAKEFFAHHNVKFVERSLADDPSARDESGLAGVREGHLAELFAQAGLGPARAGILTVRVAHSSFEQWWEPFTLGVGPAGSFVASLTDEQLTALRERCRHLLPAGPVEISASAWAAVGQI